MALAIRCSYVCPVIIGIIFILIGFIMTMVGNFRKPFFDSSSSSWCSFCKEDTEDTIQTNKNLKIAGPVMLAIGVLILIVSIIRCRSNYQNDLAENQRSKFNQPNAVTTTTRLTTYNTTGPSQPGGQTNTPYYSPQNQQQYPPATYPTGQAPYQSSPSYPPPQPQPQGYSNTGGYGPPPQPGQTPYPPMATGAPAPPYPPPQQPQESYQTKGDGPPQGVAPPSYDDIAQSAPSAPPPPSQ